MKSTLIAALLGLALPMAAQTAPPTKPPKLDEAAALQRAIDAVNRGVEKAKSPDPAATSPAAPPTAADPPPTNPPRPRPTTRPAPAKSPSPESPDPPTTRITSEEDIDFRNKEGVIVFRKNVLVDRQDLKIWSDELHISLNQQAAKKSGGAVGDTAAPKPSPEDSDAFSAQNVKQAVAKSAAGGFVVIWRKTSKGEVVAIARETIYEGATGDIILRGVPEVLRDMKLHVSSGGEQDRLVLMKSGNVRGGGSNRTAMVQEAAGRDIRRRILGHAPARRDSPASSIAPPAPNSPTAPPAPPPPPASKLPQ